MHPTAGSVRTNGITLGVEHFGDAAAMLALYAVPHRLPPSR